MTSKTNTKFSSEGSQHPFQHNYATHFISMHNCGNYILYSGIEMQSLTLLALHCNVVYPFAVHVPTLYHHVPCTIVGRWTS